MIALHDLGLSHPLSGQPLLAGASLAVEPGQVVVVAAAAGAGSSLLVQAITGQRAPSAGVVHLFERDPHRLRRAALARLLRRVGLAPQVAPLVEGWTVAEQVALALEIRGYGRAATDLATAEALERVGLLAERDVDPRAVPTAARARIGLARALAGRPELVIADAPTALQDDAGVVMVAEALARTAQAGAAVLVLARDARFDAEAVRLGMRRLVWHDGALLPHEALEVDIGGALDLILDARSVPVRRPRPPAPTASPSSDGIPNVVPFPITARSAGVTP